jgi:protein TonB
VEVAPAPDEAEQPSAPPVAAAEAASPPPNEVVTPASAAPAVAPLPKPPIKPAPSVTRGPTRAARVVQQIAPRFPMRAKRIGIEQGKVTLEYRVDKSGVVKDAVVVAAEPPRMFEEAALKAVSQWRYEPKLVNGTPTETRVRFTFHFK